MCLYAAVASPSSRLMCCASYETLLFTITVSAYFIYCRLPTVMSRKSAVSKLLKLAHLASATMPCLKSYPISF